MKLSNNEYNDHAPLVGSWGNDEEDWSPTFICRGSGN